MIGEVYNQWYCIMSKIENAADGDMQRSLAQNMKLRRFYSKGDILCMMCPLDVHW